MVRIATVGSRSQPVRGVGFAEHRVDGDLQTVGEGDLPGVLGLQPLLAKDIELSQERIRQVLWYQLVIEDQRRVEGVDVEVQEGERLVGLEQRRPVLAVNAAESDGVGDLADLDLVDELVRAVDRLRTIRIDDDLKQHRLRQPA